MSTREYLKIAGPRIDGQPTAATIIIKRGSSDCSLVWCGGNLRQCQFILAQFKDELRWLKMRSAFEDWLHDNRVHTLRGLVVWGGNSYGGVNRLPLALLDSLVALVSGFYRRALVKLVEMVALEAGEHLQLHLAGPDQNLACPVCGNEYVRLADATVVIDGKDDFRARPNVRGNVICLPGICEEGHHFTLCFGQHKGMTETWAELRSVALSPNSFASAEDQTRNEKVR